MLDIPAYVLASAMKNIKKNAVPKKCLYLEFFWSVFVRIWTEYGEIRSISQYSVQMRKNTDQENSEYRHFLRFDDYLIIG